jgi:hypothetical protein
MESALAFPPYTPSVSQISHSSECPARNESGETRQLGHTPRERQLGCTRRQRRLIHAFGGRCGAHVPVPCPRTSPVSPLLRPAHCLHTLVGASRQVGSCLSARKARASPPSPPPPPLLWEGSAPKLGTRRAPASARRAGRAGRHQTAPQVRTSAKGTKSSSRAPVARARTAACICRARARTCRSSP